jgi:hypothetical protein
LGRECGCHVGVWLMKGKSRVECWRCWWKKFWFWPLVRGAFAALRKKWLLPFETSHQLINFTLLDCAPVWKPHLNKWLWCQVDGILFIDCGVTTPDEIWFPCLPERSASLFNRMVSWRRHVARWPCTVLFRAWLHVAYTTEYSNLYSVPILYADNECHQQCTGSDCMHVCGNFPQLSLYVCVVHLLLKVLLQLRLCCVFSTQHRRSIDAIVNDAGKLNVFISSKWRKGSIDAA